MLKNFQVVLKERLVKVKKMYRHLRRSIYAKKNIPGKKLEREDIALLRPAIGFGPENLKKIIGKKAKKFIKIDSIIKKDSYMNNSGLIIFSRLDSSRLPQKALKKIGKKTLLEHVIDRAKQVQGKKKIIIATSKRTIDDQIASFAKINSIDIFRGNYKDIVKRAYDCCQFFNLKKFARICGDRPFFEPKILNFLFNHLGKKLDFATNNKIKTFPSGMICEILTF